MILKGNAVSPGYAIGKMYVYEPFEAKVSERFVTAGQVDEQLGEYLDTKLAAERELTELYNRLRESDPERAKIFIAHRSILNDEVVDAEIQDGIRGRLWAGDWAIQRTYEKYMRIFRASSDAITRDRAADLQDVRLRLLRIWHGAEEKNLAQLPEAAVVAARDILPSDAATLNRENVLAILTETGGVTSHAAIIARSYEIPAVLGIENLMQEARPGQTVLVDAVAGEVVLGPSRELKRAYKKRMDDFSAHAAETKRYLAADAVTADGVRIDIGLNIGSPTEEEMDAADFADHVGLFRTEYLYIGRPKLPGEEEQFEAYRKVLSVYHPRPVMLRTLDAGGDKRLGAIDLPREKNPFLGNRGLRLCFSLPDVFRTQLRAALRASVYGQLWLMLPMVSRLDDVRRARALLAEVQSELAAEGLPTSSSIKVGVMIEVPGLAMISDLVANEVDFASIGTNDLCQYMMAADRLNHDVAEYYESYHPSMFRLIAQVVKAFDAAKKPVAVCGEMGADVLAVPVLIGLGLRSLSMGLAHVAAAKRAITGLTIEQAQALAQAVMRLATADEVEAFLKAQLGSAAT